jgi:hypothetical protein
MAQLKASVMSQYKCHNLGPISHYLGNVFDAIALLVLIEHLGLCMPRITDPDT